VLAEGSDEHRIDTLPRRGYRFVGMVTLEDRRGAAMHRHVGAYVATHPTIVVLPFSYVSSSPDEGRFAEGVAEEIVTALSRCGGLSVITQNLSTSDKGDDIDEVRREVGVRYVVRGSIRRSGGRLRLTAQLIDATSGLHLWADRFEGNMQDAFDLQDFFTEAVVSTIEPRVERAEIERLEHRPERKGGSYELYLKALRLTYEFTKESFAAASRNIEQALLIDPSDVAAMALGAYCHAERSTQGWAQDAEAEADHGLWLAARAIEAAKDDPNVLWMAAYATLRLRQDGRLARELAHRSMRLNPNSAMSLAVAGRIEHSFGNNTTALELLGRGQRLSQLNPREWFVATGLANAYLSIGDFEGALAAANAALRQNPRSAVALRVVAASLAKLGRWNQAADAVCDLLGIDPHLSVAKLDAQRTYVKGAWWGEYLAALHCAGLPK
jgi:TolB-like protein/tetratricopeptide (TPR) repeat protein